MEMVYEGNWHTYEEWGGIRIFEDENGCFYVQDGGYSVYSNNDEPDWYEPYLVSSERVMELIDEWALIEKENEEYWVNHGW